MQKFTKAIAAIMLTIMMCFAAGCTKPDEPNNGGSNNGGNGGNSLNGHDCVDLNLPSGLLWATCNVGANFPEDYGDYFAWGETQSKDIYKGSNYTYSDNPDILPPDHDASTANWGSGWRMPTKEEWYELYQNTTHVWTTQNGVNGRLFTATNGNSLFLPAAGLRRKDNLYIAGYLGCYWSSSLYTNDPDDACGFNFNSGIYDLLKGYRRYYGRSVRAVCSARQN